MLFFQRHDLFSGLFRFSPSLAWPVDAKALLEIDPGLRSARENVPRLEKLQNEKNERLKEEAISE